jgi:hypothetical protein
MPGIVRKKQWLTGAGRYSPQRTDNPASPALSGRIDRSTASRLSLRGEKLHEQSGTPRVCVLIVSHLGPCGYVIRHGLDILGWKGKGIAQPALSLNRIRKLPYEQIRPMLENLQQAVIEKEQQGAVGIARLVRIVKRYSGQIDNRLTGE